MAKYAGAATGGQLSCHRLCRASTGTSSGTGSCASTGSNSSSSTSSGPGTGSCASSVPNTSTGASTSSAREGVQVANGEHVV